MNDYEIIQQQADDAAYYIANFLARYGRINVSQYKEKYGTVRVYVKLGWDCLLNITHPFYRHYGPYPNWLKNFDIYYGSSILKYTGLQYISFYYHRFIYRLAYKKAVAKYPEIRENILNYADYTELLEKIK